MVTADDLNGNAFIAFGEYDTKPAPDLLMKMIYYPRSSRTFRIFWQQIAADNISH